MKSSTTGRIDVPPDVLLQTLLENIIKHADDGIGLDSKTNYRLRTIKKRANNALRVLRSMGDTSAFNTEEFSRKNL